MSHIVVYEAADGSSGFERCGSLDAAIVAAERLRNVEGVALPRIFKLEEVQFDFKPYFRVEVADGDPAPSLAAVERTVIPEPPVIDAVAPAAEAEAEASTEAEEIVADDDDDDAAAVADTVDAVEAAAASVETTDEDDLAPAFDPFAELESDDADDAETDDAAADTAADVPVFEPEAELEAIFEHESGPENTGEALFDSLTDSASDAADEVVDDVVDEVPVVEVPENDSMVSVRKGLFGR